MRPLTKYPLYTKNGLPLDGNLLVTNHGTQTAATLTDINGTALTNPVLIANGLPTTQVFVGDVDVDITVRDSANNTVFSYVDLANATIVGVTAQHLVGINTIADLRAAQTTDNTSVVLLGYYASGDKPSLVYNLVHDGTLSDDGGLTIASSTTDYYWVADSLTECDVRHYGVFPNGIGTLPNIQRIRWYFPYISALKCQYNIGSSTIHNPVFDNNVVINGSGEDTAWVYDPEGNAKFKGDIKIIGDTLRTSVATAASVYLQPRNNLIIDSNLYAVNVQECTVNVYVAFTQNFTANKCTIAYNGGTISSNYQRITNCTVDGRALTMGSNIVYSGNLTNANTWSDGDDFVTFCLLNDIPRCECNGLTVSSIGNNSGDIEIVNAVLDDLNCVQTDSTITFTKCTGTIANILCDDYSNYTAKAVFNDCNISNSNWGTMCRSIDATNTTFDVSMQFLGGSHFSNCTFKRSGVYVKVDSSTLSQSDIAFVGCRFLAAPPIFSNVVDFGSTVASIGTINVDKVLITGNYINGTTPINITDTTIYKDTLGRYTIQGNGGGMLETKLPDSYFNKVMYADNDTENFTYDASKHMRLTAKAFSISSLTFNFGETYNENTYFTTPLFVRCFATFCSIDGSTNTYDESLRYGANYSHDGYGTTYGAIEALGSIINPTDVKPTTLSNIKYQFCPQLTVTSCSTAGHTIISYDGGYATGHPRFWMTVTSYGAYDAEYDWSITPT